MYLYYLLSYIPMIKYQTKLEPKAQEESTSQNQDGLQNNLQNQDGLESTSQNEDGLQNNSKDQDGPQNNLNSHDESKAVNIKHQSKISCLSICSKICFKFEKRKKT